MELHNYLVSSEYTDSVTIRGNLLASNTLTRHIDLNRMDKNGGYIQISLPGLITFYNNSSLYSRSDNLITYIVHIY